MSTSSTPRLSGKSAFVTGAGSGIGRATARRLLDDGARVALTDLNDDAVAAVTADYDPAQALALTCDVTSTESVNAAVGAAVEKFGSLDILVNVAGGAKPHPSMDQISDEHWESELDLNLTGVMRCIRAAIPVLRDGGAIVTVSSVNGLAAFGNEPYSSAKAALSGFTKNLAVELAPRGIRTNVVAPGTVRTPVWDGQPGKPDSLVPLIPLGRVGEPEDIAAAVAFLASDDATWITGVTLPVDGGMMVGPAWSAWRVTGEDRE